MDDQKQYRPLDDDELDDEDVLDDELDDEAEDEADDELDEEDVSDEELDDLEDEEPDAGLGELGQDPMDFELDDEAGEEHMAIADDLEGADEAALNETGTAKLEDKIREHHSLSPELSAGDIDAAWDYTDVSGEESVGGTVATPDQDRVDDVGRAVGLEYQDDEPLDTEDKLAKRDRDRWELNPASTDEPDTREPTDLDGEEI